MSTLFTNGFLLNGREIKGAGGCTLLVEEFLLRVKGKEDSRAVVTDEANVGCV
jgi:hypothetical protein